MHKAKITPFQPRLERKDEGANRTPSVGEMAGLYADSVNGFGTGMGLTVLLDAELLPVAYCRL